MNEVVVPLKVVDSQELQCEELMQDLRDLILSPKYERMTIATLLGVLELTRHDMLKRYAE